MEKFTVPVVHTLNDIDSIKHAELAKQKEAIYMAILGEWENPYMITSVLANIDFRQDGKFAAPNWMHDYTLYRSDSLVESFHKLLNEVNREIKYLILRIMPQEESKMVDFWVIDLEDNPKNDFTELLLMFS